MRQRHCIGTALCLALILGAVRAAEIAQVDRSGRIEAVNVEGEPVMVRTNLRIPTAGWTALPGLESAKDLKAERKDNATTWRGTIEPAKGCPFRVEQRLSEAEGAVHLAYRVTADADAKTEGVYFWLDLPVARFGGGTCELLSGGRLLQTAAMPRERAQPRHFARAPADQAVVTGPNGTPVLTMSLDRECHIQVQDNREWGNPSYSALVRFPRGPLAKGQTDQLKVTLRLSGQADRTPAKLTLDATKTRYRLDGFGGNYCFGIESPVTQYTLDHLRVAWARTEMTPPEWEPRNDNDSPEQTDWTFLTGHDKPGTDLRREFLLAQQIQRKGIPYSVTIWHLPEWLYAKPRTDKHRPNRRRVHPDQWPELLECIGSYLLYAKRQYGVEPDLFSFNEPGIGCRVLFTAEEHREALKRLGAHFAKLGLRTKMLLGDVTSLRHAIGYPQVAAKDPEAMQYVGALAFHSWGGGEPKHYEAWADLAERLKLPLLVAELGVDAFAWRGGAYRSFLYGLREVEMYQHVLLYARPTATMQWEFTSDYGIVLEEKGADGKARLVPHARFHFIRHFCNLTPPKADALTTTSDHHRVLFTAFRGEAEGKPAVTLHIANLGAARPAVLSGVPAGIPRLRAVRTSGDEAFKELPPVAVEGGKAQLTLGPQSLLTLTTMPGGESR